MKRNRGAIAADGARHKHVRLVPPRVPEIILPHDVVLIPPGIYEAIATGTWFKVREFGVWKLHVEYRVYPTGTVNPDAFVLLCAHYNVKVTGRGDILPPSKGRYVREWSTVTQRRPSRRDRLSVSGFLGKWLDVEVRTVTKDQHRNPLPVETQYSVVARILGEHGRPF